MKNLLFPFILTLMLFFCSNINSQSNTKPIKYKYEVISTKPWKGFYFDEGGNVMVSNQPIYWTFEETVFETRKTFGVSVRLMPNVNSNDVVCRIFINDSLVRNDTFTLDHTQTEWSTTYRYVNK